jgi:hypothetical protein
VGDQGSAAVVTALDGDRRGWGLAGELRLPVERLDGVVFSLDGVLVDAGRASEGTAKPMTTPTCVPMR